MKINFLGGDDFFFFHFKLMSSLSSTFHFFIHLDINFVHFISRNKSSLKFFTISVITQWLVAVCVCVEGVCVWGVCVGWGVWGVWVGVVRERERERRRERESGCVCDGRGVCGCVLQTYNELWVYLTVKDRIQFKILLLTYKAVHEHATTYVRSLISLSALKSLRSAGQLALKPGPRSKTSSYGDRAFEVAAPNLWNNIPFNIRSAASVGQFKVELYTFMFKATVSFSFQYTIMNSLLYKYCEMFRRFTVTNHLNLLLICHCNLKEGSLLIIMFT